MTDVLEPARPGLAARLGWRVERRPRPGFAHVLGAAAGAFLVVAVVAFVVEVSGDDPTAPGVIFSALLAGLALFLGARAPGPLRSMCVTATVFAVPLVWTFAFAGGGGAGRAEVRGVYLLTLASYVVLYLFGWTKGRAIFLAGALLFFASWATFEVAGSGSRNIVPFQDQVSSSTRSTSSTGSSSVGSNDFGVSPSSQFNDSSSSSTSSLSIGSSDNTDSAATIALVIGLAFLGVGAALDRRRYAGAATPFIAVGALETLVGAVVLGANNSVLLGGLLAVAAGVVVGLIGARGDRRRATTWIGVIAVFGGLVAVLVDIAPGNAGAVGGIALGFALALGAVAWWLAPLLGEADDGNDQPPPTAPAGGRSSTFPDAAAA